MRTRSIPHGRGPRAARAATASLSHCDVAEHVIKGKLRLRFGSAQYGSINMQLNVAIRECAVWVPLACGPRPGAVLRPAAGRNPSRSAAEATPVGISPHADCQANNRKQLYTSNGNELEERRQSDVWLAIHSIGCVRRFSDVERTCARAHRGSSWDPGVSWKSEQRPSRSNEVIRRPKSGGRIRRDSRGSIRPYPLDRIEAQFKNSPDEPIAVVEISDVRRGSRRRGGLDAPDRVEIGAAGRLRLAPPHSR